MDRATDSAMKSRAHRIWVVIGLTACVMNTGCARMRSSVSSTPLMLGAAAPFGKTRTVTPNHDLYAQEVGRGLAQSRELLAQDRARAKERQLAQAAPARPGGRASRSGAAPLQVALQPPQTIAPGERLVQNGPQPSTPVAANEPTAAPRPRLTAVPPRAEPAASSSEPASTAPELISSNTPSASEPTPGLSLDPKAEAGSSELSEIVAASRARLESVTSYQVPMNRQERVGTNLLPAESVLLSIRRNPKAVRLEWPDGPSKGREVLYTSQDNKDGLMHVKMPDTIVPVPPISMAVDGPMVRRSSRHPITEAGFETIISDLEKNIAQAGAADSEVGKMSYEGLDNPGQLEQPSHKIVRVTPTGETWLVFIDPTSKLPVMVEGTAPNGDLLERYVFGTATIDPESLAAADAFDPAQRWGQSSGLLSRLARAGSAKPAPETQTQ